MDLFECVQDDKKEFWNTAVIALQNGRRRFFRYCCVIEKRGVWCATQGKLVSSRLAVGNWPNTAETSAETTGSFVVDGIGAGTNGKKFDHRE